MKEEERAAETAAAETAAAKTAAAETAETAKTAAWEKLVPDAGALKSALHSAANTAGATETAAADPRAGSTGDRVDGEYVSTPSELAAADTRFRIYPRILSAVKLDLTPSELAECPADFRKSVADANAHNATLCTLGAAIVAGDREKEKPAGDDISVGFDGNGDDMDGMGQGLGLGIVRSRLCCGCTVCYCGMYCGMYNTSIRHVASVFHELKKDRLT